MDDDRPYATPAKFSGVNIDTTELRRDSGMDRPEIERELNVLAEQVANLQDVMTGLFDRFAVALDTTERPDDSELARARYPVNTQLGSSLGQVNEQLFALERRMRDMRDRCQL